MLQSSPHNARELVEANSRLNEQEYARREIVLKSYPRAIFIQIDAPCNQDCLFCSRPAAYRHFDLETFQRDFGSALAPVLDRVERINLTGSGELLSLPRARDILAYFNRYVHAEKMFATNGSTLTPKMADTILASGNRYTIHVSLHAADDRTHEIMTASKNYRVVEYNLAHLKECRSAGRASSLTLNFIFLLTTKNYRSLPDFIRFAAEYGADGVVVYYNYVYRMDQRELSAFFLGEEANRALDEAERTAARWPRYDGRPLSLQLPPRFNRPPRPADGMCQEAWSQLMLNPSGDIITCDVAGDSRENLRGKAFMDAWNGPYYSSIRRKLSEQGTRACSSFCFRANPGSVDDLRSHIITRGKSEEEIRRFVEGG